MNEKMRNEVREIPEKATAFLEQRQKVKLPEAVPYLGMGSSYFAPMAFKYMGVDIAPEIASEYHHTRQGSKRMPHAVILSQSGRSSEALWCTELFESYTAITNDPGSRLARAANVYCHIDILAGDEAYSSSKTYINTLLALFLGFGTDTRKTVESLGKRMAVYEEKGKEMAREVFEKIGRGPVSGMYITGSGPNIATAMEAALILSESTKRCFTGLPMAQYDHGPKETAAGSIVIQVMAKGPAYERTLKLNETIARAGAKVITVEEPGIAENFSILPNIIPFNFMACYLAGHLGIGETFVVGGKVTETS
jgi:glutamine---fructose-6-phosphate transaminase (isomerizing)